MVAVVMSDTAAVFIVNVAVVAPANTVTLAGVMAVPESLDRVTTDPFAGAGTFNVTVPVEGEPPVTVDGFSDIEDKEAGFTVMAAV